MIEPKRFLDTRGAPDELKHLLRAARHEVPPRGLRSTTWHALVAKSAAAGVVMGATSTATGQGTAMAAGAASAQTLVSKGVLLLALKTVAVCGGLGIGALATHQILVEQRKTETSAPVAAAANTAKPSAVSRAPQRMRDPQDSSKVEELERVEDTPARPVLENAKRDANSASADRNSANGASAKSASATGASATGVSATGVSATGVSATGVSATGVSATGVSNAASPTRAQSSNESATDANVDARVDDPTLRARVESQRVAEVRRMLRGGDGSGALRALAELDRQVTMQLLLQEREALKIDAHLLLGHTSEAQRLAQRFRERYPNSPLSARWTGSR